MSDQHALQPPRNHRQIEVVAEATTVQGWRKQVVAGQLGEERFTFFSDEGSYMPGGQSTAPTPLTYFVSGVALWFVAVEGEFNGEAFRGPSLRSSQDGPLFSESRHNSYALVP